MKPIPRAALCGAAWGLLVAQLRIPIGWDHPFPLAAGCLVGAVLGVPVGMLIYVLSRWVYRLQSWLALLFWSAASLYIAAGLWGAAVNGMHHLLAGAQPGSGGMPLANEMALGALGYWWGITSAWPLLAFLLILAAGTHFWLAVKESDGP